MNDLNVDHYLQKTAVEQEEYSAEYSNKLISAF